MGKFYAVKNGKVPGIYTTWVECQFNTKGFPNAVFKSFENEEDAKAFMEMDNIDFTSIDLESIKAYAFVDGSFNSVNNVYGCGGFLVVKTNEGKDEYVIQRAGNDEEMASMRNVAGEILGSKLAIEKAIEIGLTELYILYDYAGIEMFATGLWEASKVGTKEYFKYYQSIKDKIKINFVKVKGHTGIPGNEEADKLAKNAVGII